jgi:hypothetical protein
MLATKKAVDNHPLIKYRKRPTASLIKVYSSYKRKPYTINYISNGQALEIKYEGPKFGLDELRNSQSKRALGGNGARVILNAPNVSYTYDKGVNVWRVSGEFPVFEYNRPIPEEMSGLKLIEFYQEPESGEDVVMEISSNIIAHHNIIYERNTTLFILKALLKKA